MRIARLTVHILISTLVCSMMVSGSALADRLPDDIVGHTTVGEASPDISEQAPDARMPSGILVSGDGSVLWARHPDDARPMASTTKMMSCLVALETVGLDEMVTVSARAAAIGGSGVYLRTGEVLSAEDLLLAMMLESSNSAAAAIAEHAAGSEKAFVDAMNARAAELGLENTAFRNPHGLDATGHHASARDLADLAREAMRDADFRRFVALDSATIPGPSGTRSLENSNLLIGEYEGATGVKTGWTTPAGYCLVASAERADVDLLCVVLGTAGENARFDEAERLLDWGFAHYRPVTLASTEQTVASVTVTDYLDRAVVARVGENAEAVLLDLDGEVRREYEVVTAVEAPVDAGQELGLLRVSQGDVLLEEIPLVAAEAVPEPDMWERVRVFFVRLWRSWFGEPAVVPAGA